MRMILLVLIGCAVGSGARAQDADSGRTREAVVKDGDTVRLHVPLSDATRHVMTAITLPDKLEQLVSGFDEKDLSVEHVGHKLFIKLLSKSVGDVQILTVAGDHVRLNIVAAEAGQPFDAHVVLRRVAADSQSKAVFAAGAIELIKAMRLGQRPSDANVRAAGDERVYESEDITATLVWIYETARYRGIVLRLANRSTRESYAVDVSRFASAQLVLIAARDALVLPSKATLLYVVFWK